MRALQLHKCKVSYKMYACSLTLTSQMHIWQTWVGCCARRGAVEVLSVWRVLQLRRPGRMQPGTNEVLTGKMRTSDRTDFRDDDICYAYFFLSISMK